MYYRNKHLQFAPFRNRANTSINPSNIFSYNSKYHMYYNNNEEAQNDELLVQNFNKLNTKSSINLNTSLSDCNISLSENDVITKTVSEILNNSHDSEFVNRCNDKCSNNSKSNSNSNDKGGNKASNNDNGKDAGETAGIFEVEKVNFSKKSECNDRNNRNVCNDGKSKKSSNSQRSTNVSRSRDDSSNEKDIKESGKEGNNSEERDDLDANKDSKDGKDCKDDKDCKYSKEDKDCKEDKENLSNSTRETDSGKIENLETLSLVELSKLSISLSRDQSGCRYLQKMIEQTDFFSNEVFSRIKSELLEVINDPFGNYLIQKMIETLNEDNTNFLVSTVNQHFLSIAKNSQGTRVIQKLIEFTNNAIVRKSVQRHALELFKDNNGYHIILKYSNVTKKLDFIEKVIEDNLLEIAMNKFGCCAIQKYLQSFPKPGIIKIIIANTERLITNIYGNYVIQFIISMNNQEYNYQIVEKFKNNIIYLSKQKFSSNVIERCFDFCKDAAKNILINYICEEKVVAELLLDMYGNYVLQKALSSCKEPYYSKFMTFLGPLMENLKLVAFGSKLYNKLTQNYPEIKKFKSRKTSYAK